MAQWYLSDSVDIPYYDEFLSTPDAPDTTPPQYANYNYWLLNESSEIPYRPEFITINTNLRTAPPEYKIFSNWLLNEDSELPYRPEFIEIKNNLAENPPEYKDYTHWLLNSNSTLPYLPGFIDPPKAIDSKPIYKDFSQWLIDSKSNIPYRREFLKMDDLIKDDVIAYIKSQPFLFDEVKCINNLVLKADYEERTETIRHISVISTNLVSMEREYDTYSLLKTVDGLFLEVEEDEGYITPEYNPTPEPPQIERFYMMQNNIFKNGYSYSMISTTDYGFSLGDNGLTCPDLNGYTANIGCYITPIITQDFIRENGFTKLCALVSGNGCSITSGQPSWTHATLGVNYNTAPTDRYYTGAVSMSIGSNYNGAAADNMGVFEPMEFSLGLNLLEEKDFYILLHSYRFSVSIHAIWFE